MNAFLTVGISANRMPLTDLVLTMEQIKDVRATSEFIP